MVWFVEVVIDLYVLVTWGCFFRNALTSLNVTSPFDNTALKKKVDNQ